MCLSEKQCVKREQNGKQALFLASVLKKIELDLILDSVFYFN